MIHIDTEPHWLRLTYPMAKAYEHYLMPRLFTPYARQLTALAGLVPGEWVLDVACATGSAPPARLAIVADGWLQAESNQDYWR